MITLHTREEALSQFPQLPTSNYTTDIYTYPETFGNYILTLNNPGAYADSLAIEFSNLSDLLDIHRLVFMPDSASPWNFLENDSSAQTRYFSKLLPRGPFNGAIIVTTDELPAFFSSVFKLVTQNMSQPVTYFMDTQNTVLGNICSYGNVHIDLLKANRKDHFEKILNETSFIKLPAGTCGPGQLNDTSRSMRI